MDGKPNLMESDGWRLLLMSVITSLFPVLQILNIVSFTSDQIAVIIAFINNVTLFAAYVIKSTTSKSSSSNEVKVDDTKESTFEHTKINGGICTTYLSASWSGSPSICQCGQLRIVGEHYRGN